MRYSRQPLRGSVQGTSVRLRAREDVRFGFLARLGALAASLMLLGGLAFWLWHIGWPQRQAEHLLAAGLHMTQQARFAIADIEVEGRQQTNKDNLSAALGVAAGAPILSFDPAVAQARIAKLPWVESVTVERRLPDTILVRLTERVPLARWQHEGRTVVIDANGKELPEAPLDQFAQLPLVVGAGAQAEAKNLLDALKDAPAVAEKMTAAVRVGERRWDIHLPPKIIARMPETGLAPALQRLAQLITQEKILDRNVTAIDLRLPDRLVIEPGGPVSSHPAGDTRL